MLSAILVFASAQLQPPAPDWRELDATPDRKYFWNPDSVVRNGETTTVQLRRQPGHAGPDSYAISRIEIRCAAGLVRVVATVNYATDGREVGRDTRETQFDRHSAGFDRQPGSGAGLRPP